MAAVGRGAAAVVWCARPRGPLRLKARTTADVMGIVCGSGIV